MARCSYHLRILDDAGQPAAERPASGPTLPRRGEFIHIQPYRGPGVAELRERYSFQGRALVDDYNALLEAIEFHDWYQGIYAVREVRHFVGPSFWGRRHPAARAQTEPDHRQAVILASPELRRLSSVTSAPIVVMARTTQTKPGAAGDGPDSH